MSKWSTASSSLFGGIGTSIRHDMGVCDMAVHASVTRAPAVAAKELKKLHTAAQLRETGLRYYGATDAEVETNAEFMSIPELDAMLLSDEGDTTLDPTSVFIAARLGRLDIVKWARRHPGDSYYNPRAILAHVGACADFDTAKRIIAFVCSDCGGDGLQYRGSFPIDDFLWNVMSARAPRIDAVRWLLTNYASLVDSASSCSKERQSTLCRLSVMAWDMRRFDIWSLLTRLGDPLSSLKSKL